jgi:quercetin dioxygenase-like cupin family protein
MITGKRTVTREAASPRPRLKSTGLGGALHLDRAYVLNSMDVEARPWQPFADQHGVRDKVLWRDPVSGSYAGLMELAPGARVVPHVHRRAVHHLYVVSGSCELSVSERVVGPGAYAFVPAETPHGIEKAGPEGCALFFLYLRHMSPKRQGR